MTSQRYDSLRKRLGSQHVDDRLVRESHGKQPAFTGTGFLDFIQNRLFSAGFLAKVLKTIGLYRRGQQNVRNIEVVELTHTFVSSRAPSQMTLLHMSDLHIDVFPDFADVILGSTCGLEYDAVVLTGDYRFDTAGDSGPALRGMSKLAEGLKGPIFAVLGNHDNLSMVSHLESYGLCLLINESVEIAPGIFLSGIDDPHYFRCHDIKKATAQVPEDALSILLAHSPEIYEEASRHGIDLLLCGHTHGGQIRLPGGFPLTINADCPRKYGSGRWAFASMVGYTSKGTGSSLLDVRFNCTPEVALHHIKINSDGNG